MAINKAVAALGCKWDTDDSLEESEHRLRYALITGNDASYSY